MTTCKCPLTDDCELLGDREPDDEVDSPTPRTFVDPSTRSRRRWTTAAAAGLLVLLVGVGGSVLLLKAKCGRSGRQRGRVLATGMSLNVSQAFMRIPNVDGSSSLRSLEGELLTLEEGGSLVLVDTCAMGGLRAVSNADGTTSLKSELGSFVSAQQDGRLSADCDGVGSWQRFVVAVNDDGTFALKSTHGKFLAVQEGAANASSEHVAAAVPREPKVEVCSVGLSVPSLDEPPLWNLSKAHCEQCFKMVAKKMPALTAGGHLQRNWCWVGLKESGCHQHWTDHRPWARMQGLASGAGMTIDTAHFEPLRSPHLCDRKQFGAAKNWTASEREEAGAWFSEAVSVYVLSLPTEEERLEGISARLQTLGIPFTVSWGVDLSKRGAIEEAQRRGLIPPEFNLTRAQSEALKPWNDMGRYHAGGIAGTVGCLAGHFRAQRNALEAAGPKPLAVIFENDVSPEDDFVPRLWSLVTRELPCDWQVVSLASRCAYGQCMSEHLSRVLPDVNEPAWRCHHGVNIGFQGTLYRVSEIEAVQRLWRKTAFDEERPHCLDVDVALAAISDHVAYYAVPNSQGPGLLKEVWYGNSTRISINLEDLANVSGLEGSASTPPRSQP